MDWMATLLAMDVILLVASVLERYGQDGSHPGVWSAFLAALCGLAWMSLWIASHVRIA